MKKTETTQRAIAAYNRARQAESEADALRLAIERQGGETTDALARCEACGEPWPCEKSHKYFHKARVTTDALARITCKKCGYEGAIPANMTPGEYAKWHGWVYPVESSSQGLRSYCSLCNAQVR